MQRRQPGTAPRGIDLLRRQRRDRRVEVEVDDFHILLAQPLASQRRVEGQLAGGATEDGHTFALEVLQGLDP
ncbi:hypothetical protein D3C71_1232170 [compost metagenome]